MLSSFALGQGGSVDQAESVSILLPCSSQIPAFICTVLDAVLQWRSNVKASGFLSCRLDLLDTQLWQSQAQEKLELVALSACPALCPVLLACAFWPLPLCGLLSWWALLPLGSCICLSCACFLWSISLGMALVYSWLRLWFFSCECELLGALIPLSSQRRVEQLLIYTHVSLAQTSAVSRL